MTTAKRTPKEYSRKELYDLVWSEPMVSLAKRFGLSDVGLAKACRALDVPLPYRGYWAKLAAGKKVIITALSPRGIGKMDTIEIGGSQYYWNFDFLNFEIPPPPMFDEDDAAIIKRVKVVTVKVKIAKTLSDPHHLVRRLLDLDAERQGKASASYFSHKPYFDNPFEKRRLKILNALFLMAQTCGFKPQIDMTKARDHSLTIGDQRVGFDLDSIKALSIRGYDRRAQYLDISDRAVGQPMRLRIDTHHEGEGSARSWEDTQDDKIEDHLREIFEAFVFYGELHVRARMLGHHRWLIGRKEAAQEAERTRLAEIERRQRERQQQLEKLQIDTLLAQAESLREAEAIRRYVERSRQLLPEDLSREEKQVFDGWAQWASSQADRIDPVKARLFLAPPPTLDDDTEDD